MKSDNVWERVEDYEVLRCNVEDYYRVHVCRVELI